MKLSKELFSAGISLGIETMRKNLPEPLKIVEQGVIASCKDIGLDPEHEINGIPFVGRVMVRVMEAQLGENLMPEAEEDCAHLIFCTKVAAYADAFGAEKAAEEYELTVKQVEEISLLVHGFQDEVAGIGERLKQKAH
ncbi:hypothetical protein [Klebsiella michiganensis]|uniref:hypothetical protein n=1 Tax=Klebsiella michiganensis TaxID=1134687 RepID=UPI000EFCFB66|nr:hypothetical protein [Klebsiella michiganensis]RMC71706.1 hypothetical protein EBH72_31690 [Klebsiella michiganensis]